MRRISLLLILGAFASAILVPNASAATGDLAFQSCQSNAIVVGQSCTVQAGLLHQVSNITISPDGKNAYGAALLSDALVVFDRNTTSGALTIKSGSAGCFVNTTIGACTVVSDLTLDGIHDIAVSPDGKSLYAASQNSDTLVSFTRDTTTGALTVSGCLSNSALGASCVQQPGLLDEVAVVTVSPDGKNVYAVSAVTASPNGSGVISTYSRDATTGALTYNNCISSAPLGSCVVTTGVFDLGFPYASKIALSPDGKTMYLIASSSASIAIFDRDATTGTLTLKSGAAGCIARAAILPQGCTILGDYLQPPTGIAVSPDGKSLYLTTSWTTEAIDTVLVFARDTTTGVLTKTNGAAGCLASATLSDCAVFNPSAQTSSDFNPAAIVVSPDNQNVYLSSSTWNTLYAFDRSATTGALTLKSGASGCFSSTILTPCTTTANLTSYVDAITVSPDGRSLYTGSATDPNISVFARSRPPALTTVTPARGPTAGGTSVVIAGVNLDGATAVIFGGKTATITANTATSLTVTTPLHIAGTVDLIITTADGTQTSKNAFTFVLPTIKIVLVTAKPTIKIARRSITLRTITTINMAGTIKQVISRTIRGKARAVCTITKRFTRAGKFPITCTIGLTTRNALKRGQLRLKVTTTFSVTGAQSKSTTHLVTLTRRR